MTIYVRQSINLILNIMKKLFVILTKGYMDEPYLEKNGEKLTMLFNTEEQAQEIIDENNWEDSSVIELYLQK